MKKMTKMIAVFLAFCLCFTSANFGSAAFAAAKKSVDVTIKSKNGSVIVKAGGKTYKMSTGIAAGKNAITISADKSGNTIVTVVGEDGKKITKKLGAKAADIKIEGSASKLTIKDTLSSTNVILQKSSNINALSSKNCSITVNGTVTKASTTGGSLIVAETAKLKTVTVRDAKLTVDGAISGTLTAKGETAVNVNAGAKLSTVAAAGESTLKLSQGAVVKNISASEESQINVAGNVTGTIKAEGKAEVNALNGAMVYKIDADGSTLIKANSGSYIRSVEADGEASITMKKGAEAIYVTTDGSSQAKLAGAVNNVVVRGDAIVSVNKGAVVASVFNADANKEVVLGKGSAIGTIKDSSLVKDNGATIDPSIKNVVEEKKIDSKPAANPTPVPTKAPTQAPAEPTTQPTTEPTQATTQAPVAPPVQPPVTEEPTTENPIKLPKIASVSITDQKTMEVTLDTAKAGLVKDDFTVSTGATNAGGTVNEIVAVAMVPSTARYTITLSTPIKDGNYVVITAKGKNLAASTAYVKCDLPVTVTEAAAVSRTAITFNTSANITGIKVGDINVAIGGKVAPYASVDKESWTVILKDEQGLIAGKEVSLVVEKTGKPSSTTTVSYEIVADNSEKLKTALETGMAGDTIQITGTIGDASNIIKEKDVYEVTRAVTLKGKDSAIVNGSFVVKADGVVFEDLTIQNPGDAVSDAALRCAINYYGDEITIKSCVFKNARAELNPNSSIICNGVAIFPKSDQFKCEISGNTFNGFNGLQEGYSSTGLLIADRYSLNTFKTFFNVTASSGKATVDDLAIIRNNTFESCQNDYDHSDFTNAETGTASKIIVTSNSASDNFRLNYGAEGSKHYVTGDVIRKSNTEIKAGSELIVMEGKKLTIDSGVTLKVTGVLTVNGTLIVNGTLDSSIADSLTGTGTIVVNSEQALNTAISSSVAEIRLGSSITTTSNVFIKRLVNIDGGSNTLTVPHNTTTEGINDSLVFFSGSEGSVLKDITVSQSNNTTNDWKGSYCIQVYTLNTETAVTLHNVTATGGDAGILVNGSKVTMEGKIDVSGNEGGGIEVSKGAGVTTAPSLDISNVTELTNGGEEKGKATIWIDQYESNNASWVVNNGSITLHGCEVTVANQVKQYQFYLKAENATSLVTETESK